MVQGKVAGLMNLSKEQLAKGYASAHSWLKNAKAKAEAPIKQGTRTVSGLLGGCVSGAVHAYIPEVMGLPVDGTLGVIISLGSLLYAGDTAADAAAVFGVGLAAPALSRGTESLITSARQKAAANKK